MYEKMESYLINFALILTPIQMGLWLIKILNLYLLPLFLKLMNILLEMKGVLFLWYGVMDGFVLIPEIKVIIKILIMFFLPVV
jgi:hypothetical protein